MMMNKDKNIKQLENIVQQSLDTLEICALFEDKQSILDNIYSIEDLFAHTVEVLQKRVLIHAHSVFTIKDKTKDMSMEYCFPQDMKKSIDETFESLVENGYVAWALREKRLITSTSRDGQYQVLLHSLTTRTKVHGLFLAFISPFSFSISNVNSLLFSILLRSTAFAYENFMLYSRVDKQKKELGQTVQNLHLEMQKKEKVEISLRQSEVMYRNVFENTGNPTVIVNIKGLILLANSQFATFSGYETQDLENRKSIFDFLEEMDLSVRSDPLASCSLGKTQQPKQEALFYDKNNFKSHVLLHVHPLGINDSLIISLADISKIKIVEERLSFQAYYDQLTHLPNRSFFSERLEMAIRKAVVSKEYNYAVIFIDIDRLKTINDTMGHAAGDQMIVAVAHKLKSCTRDVDTLARFGGDEFVLLLEGIKEKKDCELIMQRFFAEFKTPVRIGGKEIFATFSSGIYLGTDEYKDVEDVIRCADLAMYQTKRKGRNKYEYYDQKASGQEVKKLYLEQDLLRAISNNEIYLQFQPIIDLQSNRIFSVEALARWNHPELGNIPPDQFIPIAESTNLVHPLGMKIFSLAFQHFVQWKNARPDMKNVNLAINMSVKQFIC